MGHEGQSKTTQGQNNQSVTGKIGSSGYHYEIWYQGGNNSMTYYDNGTFKASWGGTNDFLARVGLKYNEDKTHQQLGQIDAYFKWTKSGSAGGYNYIGIYGWTVDPLVEYYIVDDWYNKPGSYLGQKKGEFTVDGDTYEIFQNTRVNQPSIKGTSTFPQFFSVRRSARSCGHIDISAHFKKWESLGMKLGKMYEAKVLVEAGGGSGSFDVTYFKMTDGSSVPKTTTTTTTTVKKTTTIAPRPSTKTLPSSCSSKITAQGYKCCSDPNCVVYYTDADGTWGVENGQWCGCGSSANCSQKIIAQGYKCCADSNCTVYYTDADGTWGVENGEWCGCGSA
ncbi:concanavalin A-like lectin/glucanase [Anaeromyces robustus]|uniref:Endo-1,4-beta-xylanase n=1 Tax=Anaeromyces robustus TaxID=1754192 RepID=A0A1Y1UJ95_9FUNG|nr:concanavalin A-like lectin/glucanase [Anaeromyces robustus]|eukprot:ORX38140.1 concanavalin A-like lectin/glucanase [Anaeromyces robustus]